MSADLGNTFAREGLDRCFCGCKYWEYDRCIDCGTHISALMSEPEWAALTHGAPYAPPLVLALSPVPPLPEVDDTPFGRDGDHCPWCGCDWKAAHYEECRYYHRCEWPPGCDNGTREGQKVCLTHWVVLSKLFAPADPTAAG